MAMLPEGLSLELLPLREPAFLPLMHLSDHMELCPFLLDIHREQLEFATTSTPYKLCNIMIVCPKLPSRPIVSILLLIRLALGVFCFTYEIHVVVG